MGSTNLVSSLKSIGLRRLVKWLALSLPAGFAIVSLVLTMARKPDRFQSTNERLRQAWPALRAANRWPEAELAGYRLLAFEKLSIPEDMAYFDTLMGLGDPVRARFFLESRERLRPAGDLASFRIRYAEKLLQTAPTIPFVVNRAIGLLRQAIAGGLTSADDFKARRLLGSQAYASSDYELAIELLKPLETESVDVAVEIVWIRWIMKIDGDTTEARSEARKLLDELLRQTSQRKKFRLANPTPRELSAIAMLLVILGRENEFLDVTRELIVLSPVEKERFDEEIQDYRLNAELKKRKPDFDVVAPILTARLEKRPNDLDTLRQSILIWSVLPAGADNALTKYVQKRLESTNVDIPLLHFAGDRCRESGKWAEARKIYSRLMEKSPDDFAVLNNLAESYYKVEPYEYEKALSMANRAEVLAPGNPAVIETRGQIQARLGKVDEAKDLLEECLAVYPEDWNLRNTLVWIYERLGDKEKAEGHRRFMKDLKPPPGSESFAKLP